MGQISRWKKKREVYEENLQLNKEKYRQIKANKKRKQIKMLSIVLPLFIVFAVSIFLMVFLGFRNLNGNTSELNSDAFLLSVDGGAIQGLESTIRVPEDVEGFDLKEKITVSEGASWKLYKDVDCNEQVFSGTINDLEIGINVYYIVVQSENGRGSTVYKLNVVKSNEFTLTLNKNFSLAGTVTGEGNKVYDSEVTVEATSNPGYTFLGWYEGITVVSTNSTYTFLMPSNNRTLEARWKVNTYTVTIVSSNIEYGDVNIKSVMEVPYGTVLKIKNNVVIINGTSITASTKANTMQYTYTFAGWINGTAEVKEDLTVTANFTRTTNKYTYTFYKEDGITVVKSEKVEYGSEIVEPAAPLKAKTQEFTYTFTGWDKEVPLSITEDIVFKATYTSTKNKYTVTFVDYNGTTLKTQEVEYGMSATAPSEPNRTGRTFIGWDKSFLEVKDDIIVNAEYTINKYTITFESNGGSTVESITQDYESTVEKPTNPYKEGYTFAGWYSNSNLEEDYAYTFTIMPLGGVKLYAKWSVGTYSISYTLNGGVVDENTPNLESYSIETDTFTLNNPTKVGYIFNGWSGTNLIGENNKVVEIAKGNTGDRNYTAHWIAKQFTITFNTDGGGTKDDVKVTYDTSYDLGEVTRTGYDFKGWYDNEMLVSTSGSAWKIASDMTLKASWEAKTYQVSFITTGGNKKNPVDVKYKDPYDLGIATKEGYDFMGWYDGSTLIPTTGSEWKIADNINLTATWEATKYQITYNLQDNETSVASNSNPTEYTIENAVVLANPIRNGYDFKGWTTLGLTTPTKGLTIPKNSTGAKTFTAYWTAIEYDINYINVNVGENASANPTKYNIESLDITLADPSRDGSTFIGWTTTEITTPTKDLKIVKGSTGVKTFIANWEINKYTVTFTVNDVTYGSLNHDSVEVDYGTTLSHINNVLTAGNTTVTATPNSKNDEYTYEFVNWTNGTATITGEGIIVTANFKAIKNSYSVSFEVNNASYGSVYPSSILNVEYGTTISVIDNKIKIGNITVTANANEPQGKYEYKFVNWTGDITTQLIGDTFITANFEEKIRKRTVTINASPTDYGTVNGESTIQVEVEYGTTLSFNNNKLNVGDIIVTATSIMGTTDGYTYKFDNWTNGDVQVMEATTVTANFSRTLNTYTVTINLNDNDRGQVSSTSIEKVPHGTTINHLENNLYILENTIIAIPKIDTTGEWEYEITSWTIENEQIIGPTTVIANFAATKIKYDVSFTVNNIDYGYVSPSDTLNVDYGTTISVTSNKVIIGTTEIEATPTTSDVEYTYAFSNWTIDGTELSGTNTVTGTTEIRANFTRTINQYTLTLNNDPIEGGVLTGGGTYAYNTHVTITATAYGGREFYGWYEDNEKIEEAGPSWEIIILEDKTYTAKWGEPLYIRVNEDGSLNNEAGDYLLFGEFPQTREEDTSKVSTVTTPAPAGGHFAQYYLGTDGTTKYVKYGDSYYKVEWMKWKILDEDFNGTGKALIVSANAIMGKRYTIKNGGNIYRDSEIRNWQNKNFFNTAFTDSQKNLIPTTSVDNSEESTGYENNPYATENTDDKVFLLSYQEAFNDAYFSGNASRQIKATDFAIKSGAYAYDDGNCLWWLRSPSANDSTYALYILRSGGYTSIFVHASNRSVVPALVIDLV